MEQMLAAAKRGDRIQRSLTLIVPTDQSAEYQKAIRQIEMSAEDVIDLDDDEFSCYVMDRWAWKKQWGASNRLYSATLAGMSPDEE